MIKNVPASVTEKLYRFLLSHEDDIHNHINDFGDLYSVFLWIVGYLPMAQDSTKAAFKKRGCGYKETPLRLSNEPEDES